MHPFCCVSDQYSSSLKPHFTDFPMLPPLPPASAVRSDPVPRPANHNVGHHSISISHNNNNSSDVKINDLVGNGVSGILYKWVNYGKGWRPRWFVLQDGVLSYYKIHGPDKIVVNLETAKGSKVIGEESMRRISRNRNSHNHHSQFQFHRRKPFGEVHLKVSTIRESKSDDKRFSIFTGTKRLHLRAETREDRVAWMEALQAVKDMFPRMSNSELMAPVDNVSISTEKLRHRLLEEGVSEAVIQDSEQIMRNEFATLQQQLVLLKQKQLTLMDTLRQLEVQSMKSGKVHTDQIVYSCWISTTVQEAAHS